MRIQQACSLQSGMHFQSFFPALTTGCTFYLTLIFVPSHKISQFCQWLHIILPSVNVITFLDMCQWLHPFPPLSLITHFPPPAISQFPALIIGYHFLTGYTTFCDYRKIHIIHTRIKKHHNNSFKKLEPLQLFLSVLFKA